jgi:hypothetical protein
LVRGGERVEICSWNVIEIFEKGEGEESYEKEKVKRKIDR